MVTLGSPHAGSQLARVAPLLVGRQLRPNSELMRELAGPARCGTHFVAIYSDRDEVVVPHRSARLEHPDLNVSRLQVRGVGHLSLLVNSSVAHAVAAALTGERRPGNRSRSRRPRVARPSRLDSCPCKINTLRFGLASP